MRIDVTDGLRLNVKARDWCRLPYPGHPNGCPNVGNRFDCPPHAPLVGDHFDLQQQMWMVIEPFNLADHQRRMLARHPNWTDRQTRNVLYWQGGVKARLKEAARRCAWEYPGSIVTLCPEAMGVNVIATLQRQGVGIKVHPDEWVYKVALVGYPQEALW